MKKYYKDYKLVTKQLQNGKIKQELEYAGKYYCCRLNATELIKVKLYYLALVLCSDAAVIGVGLLNTSGSRVAYVILPYVCMFFPAVFCLIGTIRFIASGLRLEFAAYDRTRNRIFRSTIGLMVLSCLTVIGDICYLLFERSDKNLRSEIVFLSGMLLVLVLSILFIRIQKKVIYEVEEPIV